MERWSGQAAKQARHTTVGVGVRARQGGAHLPRESSRSLHSRGRTRGRLHARSDAATRSRPQQAMVARARELSLARTVLPLGYAVVWKGVNLLNAVSLAISFLVPMIYGVHTTVIHRYVGDNSLLVSVMELVGAQQTARAAPAPTGPPRRAGTCEGHRSLVVHWLCTLGGTPLQIGPTGTGPGSSSAVLNGAEGAERCR